MSGIALMGQWDQKGALRGSSVCGLCLTKPVPQVFKAATGGILTECSSEMHKQPYDIVVIKVCED